MAAGLGFKDFTTGEVLTAADVDGYLMQGVWVFADAAARTAAVTSPQEGNVSFLKDTNSTEYYSGSAWVAIGGSVPTSLEFTAGKNKIINSDFGVWQRGTTVSANNTYAYLSDRWQSVCDGNFSGSRQNFTPGAAPVAGYEGKYFFRYTKTSGTYWQVQQPIEDVQTLAGQTATISFWAKVDAAKTVYIQLTQNFGSGGSAAVTTSAGTQALTTSWARYSFTVAVPSISGKTVGTSSSLALEIGIGATTGNITLDLWGVQVEAGSTATSFQTATGTIQGELAACQRYFYRALNGANNANERFGGGQAVSSSAADFPVRFGITMRTAPSLTVSSASNFRMITSTGGATAAPSSIVSFYATPTTSNLSATGSSSLTAGNMTQLEANSSSATLDFSAEL